MSSRLRYALAALLRNLRAGLRLALFMPVGRLAFRVDMAQVVLLFAVLCLVDIGGDHLRYAHAPFNPLGAGSELAGIALLAAMALLVAWLLRSPGIALALVVSALAALPLVQVLYYAVALAAQHAAIAGYAIAAILAWQVAILVRVVALHVAEPSRRRWPRAALGGLVLALPLAVAPLFIADVAWFHGGDGPGNGEWSAASEPVLAAQRELLDDALGSLDDRAPGATNLYFVVYAPDGNEPLWNEHAESVRALVDERLGTKGRSIVLRTHADTMLATPFATVSNLRETFNEIAAAGDPEQDVLMLYLGGASTPDGAIAATLAPLDLVALTPAGLRSLLDDAGFAWRIVVVNACHASAFAAALDDDHTAVVGVVGDGAGACTAERDPANFGDALFGEGFAHTDSLTAAFAVARERMAGRNASAAPPLLQVGTQIEPMVRHLRRFGGGATAQAALLRQALWQRTARGHPRAQAPRHATAATRR